MDSLLVLPQALLCWRCSQQPHRLLVLGAMVVTVLLKLLAVGSGQHLLGNSMRGVDMEQEDQPLHTLMLLLVVALRRQQPGTQTWCKQLPSSSSSISLSLPHLLVLVVMG